MKTNNLANYLADYINEELERGNDIDVYTLKDAIDAFEGGAGVKHSIFIEWCIDDVKDVREDLDYDQAFKVLEFVKDKYDANLGITWRTLQYAANHLFPEEVLP